VVEQTIEDDYKEQHKYQQKVERTRRGHRVRPPPETDRDEKRDDCYPMYRAAEAHHDCAASKYKHESEHESSELRRSIRPGLDLGGGKQQMHIEGG
jgi:hypothetical protein